jgi:exopolysaccharide biosynthesis polyprenyl glycosylphosphotransferase
MAGSAPADTASPSNVTVPDTRRLPGIRTFLNVFLYVLDATMLGCAFLLAYWSWFNIPLFGIPDGVPPLTAYAGIFVMHVLVITGVFYLSRLYHLPRAVSRIDLARNITMLVTVGTVIAYGASELLLEDTRFDVPYPQTLFLYVTIYSIALAGIGREFFRILQNVLRRVQFDIDNLLIVGTGSVAHDMALRIQNSPELGYNFLGLVTRGGEQSEAIPGIAVIGSYENIPDLIDRHDVEQVIIALPDAKRVELVELINMCQRGQVDVKVYPDVLAYMSGDMNIDDLGGTPLITVRDIALRGWKLSLKRGLDIVGSVIGLIFLSPLMLLTAILIRRESDGPVFYTQERMGLDGKPFEMIKFRSMRLDAEQNGPGWTVPGDPRVTRLGRFLRTSNWDEIPQLINVFLGQMSLVGPRPERPIYVQEFRQNIPRYMERHREKAGMTGWAQVNGLRGDTSIAERTAFDLWYVENWSLWLDIKIIIRTIYMTIRRRSTNAY